MTCLFEPIRSLPRFSRQAPFEHWLSRVAVRTCYDFWRARRRCGDSHEYVDGGSGRLAGSGARRRIGCAVSRSKSTGENRWRCLDWALAQLSPENRLVLTLVHLEGRSAREAADLLGWSLVNVKVRCHRARQKLRTLFLQEWERQHNDRTS